MRWTNCLWMPTAIGIHRRNHFQQLLNVNGDNDVGNTHGKVLIFVVVVLINNFGTEPHPPPIPPPKGLQHRAISSQSMLSHSSASPEWHLVSATWRPLSTLPDTDSKEGYSPVTEKCHGHCDPPACQPEISCCGNIWQRECLHFTFPPLKTQKPTLGTRSRSHTETLCTGLWTTLQCDYSSILHRRVHNWIN